MTEPALSFKMAKRGRHYPYPPQDHSAWPRNRWGSVAPEDIPAEVMAFPSVTNILRVVDKGDVLLWWAAEMAIRAMYRDGVPQDVERAVALHRGAFRERRDERAESGTRAHTLAEVLTRDLALPSSISEEDEAYADAFMAFWGDFAPEPLEVEATVYGSGYAGTADLIAKVEHNFSRVSAVVDYKTRAKRDHDKIAKYGVLYESTKLQLAALAHAPYVASRGQDGWELLPAPPIDTAFGVVLFPDGSYVAEEVPELGRWYDAFRGALQLWKGVKGV